MPARPPSSWFPGAIRALGDLAGAPFKAAFGGYLTKVAGGDFAGALTQFGPETSISLAGLLLVWGVDAFRGKNKEENEERARRKAAEVQARLRKLDASVGSALELLDQLTRTGTPLHDESEQEAIRAVIDAALDSRLQDAEEAFTARFVETKEILRQLATKEDLERLVGELPTKEYLDRALERLRDGAPAPPCATLTDYLERIRDESTRHLLERFRIDRDGGRAQSTQQALTEIYVELDIHRDAPAVRSALADLMFEGDRLEDALRERGLGADERSVFWSPLGRAINATALVDGFAVLPVETTWSPAAPPGERLGQDLDELAQGLAAEDDPPAFLVTREGAACFSPDEWVEAVRELRARFPDARVIQALTGETLILEHLLALDPELHDLPGRYVLRGHPGTGKTTALRHAAARAAARAFEAPAHAAIPVPISLPGWAKSSANSLEERMREEHRELASPELLDQLTADGGRRLILLCDGLDEVPDHDDGRLEIRNRLLDIARTLPRARVAVATRLLGFEALPEGDHGYAEVDLRGLDGPRQRELLLRWLTHGKRVRDPVALTDRILAHLDEGGAIFQEMREVPLLLTFVAMLYEDKEGDAEFRLTKTRSKLYHAILEHLRQGLHRERATPMKPARGSKRALQLLARKATVEDGSELNREDLAEELLAHWTTDADLKSLRTSWVTPDGKPDAEAFLNALGERTGILFGEDRDEAPWQFWHRSLREALAAQFLLGEAEEAKDAAGNPNLQALLEGIEGFEDNPWPWAEPFALFVGLTPLAERDAWLLQLREHNPALAFRALASVDGLAADTILEVLQLEELGEEERCAQYAQLEDRLGGGPEAKRGAVKLLGRLARGTDSCMELWHILNALKAFEDEEGLRSEREHARSELFAHESFGDPKHVVLRVPGHPEHDYWREVRGELLSFRMGSPWGEQDRFDDESPIHPVTIAQPFRIAAVPVTNELWRRFRPGSSPAVAEQRPHEPVTNVSWYEAAMFCEWLGARLPSEAEWECACRAGTQTRFWSGEEESELARVGWYVENATYSETPRAKDDIETEKKVVARKESNAAGLFDIHGNVWEWCQDRWHRNYEGAPANGQVWEVGGFRPRVFRGGSYRARAGGARSAYRGNQNPKERIGDVGFRPVALVR